MIKVSIITAVHNGAREIPVTLASIAAQSYPDIEHIVIDGASSDDTVEIVRRSERPVARIVSEPDRGVYDAFQKGLRAASGDVVAYLNAGDAYASADSISHVIGCFESQPNVDAVFGDVDILDQTDLTRVVRRYRSAGFRPERMAFGFMPAHPALFVSRLACERAGGYDASYRIAGDFEFCLRLFVRDQIVFRYLREVIVRMPRGGLSNRGWRSKCIITQEMRDACRRNGVRTNYLKLLSRFPAKAYEVLRRYG